MTVTTTSLSCPSGPPGWLPDRSSPGHVPCESATAVCTRAVSSSIFILLRVRIALRRDFSQSPCAAQHLTINIAEPMSDS
jgi:hypothetical protein